MAIYHEDETRKVANLDRRIERLNRGPGELGIEQELFLLKASLNTSFAHDLYDIVETRISDVECSLREQPFLPPSIALDCDPIHFARTLDSRPVTIDIAGGDHPVYHIYVPGAVGSGKSTWLAWLALAARKAGYDVVIIDSRNIYSRIPAIRNKFDFLPLKTLRLNPLKPPKGIEPSEHFSVMVAGLAETFSWQYGAREMLDALCEMIPSDVHFPGVLKYLDKKKYGSDWNRARYKQTVTTTLSFILNSYNPVFHCKEGMDFLQVLTHGAVVLQTDSIVAQQHVYFLRLIADFGLICSRIGAKPRNPVLIIVDEAAELLSKGDGFVNTLLTVRHSNFFFEDLQS